jgi:hypothetical protein
MWSSMIEVARDDESRCPASPPFRFQRVRQNAR